MTNSHENIPRLLTHRSGSFMQVTINQTITSNKRVSQSHKILDKCLLL